MWKSKMFFDVFFRNAVKLYKNKKKWSDAHIQNGEWIEWREAGG